MNAKTRNEGLNGTIKIFSGPMATAKTVRMLLELYQLDLAKNNVILPVKSAKDPRPPKYSIGPRIEAMRRPALIVPKLGELATTLARSRRKDFKDMKFEDVTVIGIDELMFFDDAEDTYNSVKQFAKMGKTVIASSLDVAGNGHQFPVVARMHELQADFVPLRTTCNNCETEDSARHTCIYENKDHDARPFIRETLDFYVPDDGTLGYRALCRVCYDEEDLRLDAVPFTPEFASQLRGES